MLALLAVLHCVYSLLHKCLDLSVYLALVLPLRFLNRILFSANGGKTHHRKGSKHASKDSSSSKRLALAAAAATTSKNGGAKATSRTGSSATSKSWLCTTSFGLYCLVPQQVLTAIKDYFAAAFRHISTLVVFNPWLYFVTSFNRIFSSLVTSFNVTKRVICGTVQHWFLYLWLLVALAFVKLCGGGDKGGLIESERGFEGGVGGDSDPTAKGGEAEVCESVSGGGGVRDWLVAMSHKMIDCNHLRPRFISLQRDIAQFAPFYLLPATSPSAEDDNGRSPATSGQDINGNPYSRPTYDFESKSTSSNQATSPSERSRFPSSAGELDAYMTSAARDATSSEVAGSDSSDLQKKKAKRQKKKKEDSGIKAESIPGYQGNRDLDELLNFIGDNDKQTNHKSTNKNSSKVGGSKTAHATPNGPATHSNPSASPPKETRATNPTMPASQDTVASTAQKETKKQKKKKGATTNTNAVATSTATTTKNGPIANSVTTNSISNNNKDVSAATTTTVDSASEGSSVSDLKEVTIINNAVDKAPSSPTESNASKVAKNNVKNVKNSNAQTNRTTNAVAAAVLQDTDATNYIFTDFELAKPPQEEEFKTVSSKKKKRSSNNQGGGAGHNDFFDGPPSQQRGGGGYFSGHQFNSTDFHHRESRSRHVPAYIARAKRAFTPPPPSSASRNSGVGVESSVAASSGSAVPSMTATGIASGSGRAFSPCAFPVLMRSGRRNSTGTAEGLEIGIDGPPAESDTESSVSVPVGERSSKSDTAASSSAGSSQPAINLPFSYAKAAATRRVENAAASKTVDSPDDIDKSFTSGMGERRHSLGNINMLDMPPLCGSNVKDTSSSQELLPRNDAPVVMKSSYSASLGAGSTSSTKDSSKSSSLSTSKVSSSENVNVAATKETSAWGGGGGGVVSAEKSSAPAIVNPPNPQSDFDFPHLPATESSVARKIVPNEAQPPRMDTAKDASLASAQHKNESAATDAASHISSSTLSSASQSSHVTSSLPQSIPTPQQSRHPNAPPAKQWRDVAQSNIHKSSAAQPVQQHKQSSSSSDSKRPMPTASAARVNPAPVVNKPSDVSSVSAKVVPSSQSSASSGTISSNKVKSKNNVKGSSVVFLDKKFETKSSDIGISFGFDDELVDVSHTMERTINAPPSQSSSPQVVTVQTTNMGKSLPDNNVQQNVQRNVNSHIPTPEQTINVVSNVSPSLPSITNKDATQSPKKNISDDNNVITRSSPQIHAPPGLTTQKGVTTESSSAQALPNGLIAPVASPSRGVAESGNLAMPKTEEELLSGGDSVTASATLKHFRLPSRDEDPNYQQGNFDQQRAVQYLFDAWNQVERRMEKSGKNYHYKPE